MSKIVGHDAAQPTLTGHSLTAQSFNIEIHQNVSSDLAGFGDSYEEYRGGHVGGSGSVTGKIASDGGGPGADAMSTSPVTVTINLASGCSYSGSAVIESFEASSDKQGNNSEGTFNFKWSGTITETWNA